MRTITLIPNGCSLELSLSLHGGTSHCDIYYEDGVYICSDCQGRVYCANCCNSAHKHPSRASHNPSPIASTSTNVSDIVGSQSNKSSLTEPLPNTDISGSTDPWDEDITYSPDTSQAFMEKSLTSQKKKSC